MNNSYIIAHLKDGTCLDFNKKCTTVKYHNDILIIFNEDLGDDMHKMLAIIPYESIFYIETVDEEVQQ